MQSRKIGDDAFGATVGPKERPRRHAAGPLQGAMTKAQHYSEGVSGSTNLFYSIHTSVAMDL
jgi:hypothetical protein